MVLRPCGLMFPIPFQVRGLIALSGFSRVSVSRGSGEQMNSDNKTIMSPKKATPRCDSTGCGSNVTKASTPFKYSTAASKLCFISD